MDTTSASLLAKIQNPATESDRQIAWQRFVEFYTPMLLLWARRLGTQEADTADLVQNVFAVVVKEMPKFRYDPNKKFRAWLRTILINQFRNWKVSAQVRHEITHTEQPDPLDSDAADVLAEEEYQQFLVARAMEIAKVDFSLQTWQACWNCVVLGQPAAQVAAELGMSINAVYLAKARILQRLHQELTGLVD